MGYRIKKLRAGCGGQGKRNHAGPAGLTGLTGLTSRGRHVEDCEAGPNPDRNVGISQKPDLQDLQDRSWEQGLFLRK